MSTLWTLGDLIAQNIVKKEGTSLRLAEYLTERYLWYEHQFRLPEDIQETLIWLGDIYSNLSINALSFFDVAKFFTNNNGTLCGILNAAARTVVIKEYRRRNIIGPKNPIISASIEEITGLLDEINEIIADYPEYQHESSKEPVDDGPYCFPLIQYCFALILAELFSDIRNGVNLPVEPKMIAIASPDKKFATMLATIQFVKRILTGKITMFETPQQWARGTYYERSVPFPHPFNPFKIICDTAIFGAPPPTYHLNTKFHQIWNLQDLLQTREVPADDTLLARHRAQIQAGVRIDLTMYSTKIMVTSLSPKINILVGDKSIRVMPERGTNAVYDIGDNYATMLYHNFNRRLFLGVGDEEEAKKCEKAMADGCKFRLALGVEEADIPNLKNQADWPCCLEIEVLLECRKKLLAEEKIEIPETVKHFETFDGHSEGELDESDVLEAISFLGKLITEMS